MRRLDGITNSMDMSEQALGDGKGQESLVLPSTGLQRVRHNLATEEQH